MPPLTFSLKDLFYLTTISAIVLAWWIHDYKRQKHTEAQIQATRQLLEAEKNALVKSHHKYHDMNLSKVVALNKENRLLREKVVDLIGKLNE